MNWIEARQKIEASDAYSQLEIILPAASITENQKQVLAIQGWTVEPHSFCSLFHGKRHASQFIARDFIQDRSHVGRAFISCRLEHIFTDAQLTNYFMDVVYVGQVEYGIESAAQAMFQKSFEDLSTTEVIQIGLIVQNPALRENSSRLNDALDKFTASPSQ